jgi:light-regulated signal transduction histidine kinase (bacteriophytochrome)
MENAARRLRRLIDDLLTYSHLSTTGKPYQKVSLNKQLDTVLADNKITIKEKNAKITLDKLPEVYGDKVQLRQLFQNLISNSLKFSKNDVKPLIEIKNAGVKGGYYCIEVNDNGIGFDQQFVKKIFVPFQRLHNQAEYEGSGIGLAICKKIIELHSGKISAQGRVGEGVKLLIYLPTQINKEKKDEI